MDAPSFRGPIPGQLCCDRYHVDFLDWKAADPSERALYRMAYAADVIHLTEHPVGSNSGPEIDRVLSIAGVDTGNPWCASIWTAYLFDSGVLRSSMPELAGSVHEWGNWAKQHNRILSKPIRGCAGLIYHTPTTGHLVVVSSVIDSTHVAVIAGNTNNDGSREGYGCFRKIYPISDFAAFVDCRGLGQ